MTMAFHRHLPLVFNNFYPFAKHTTPLICLGIPGRCPAALLCSFSPSIYSERQILRIPLPHYMFKKPFLAVSDSASKGSKGNCKQKGFCHILYI